jgi:hypothetical protein
VEFTLSSVEDSSTVIGFILDDRTGICQASSAVNERVTHFVSILLWEGSLSVYCMCNLSLSITSVSARLASPELSFSKMNAKNLGNEYLRGVFAVRRLDLGREELETTHIGAIPRALLSQPFSLQDFFVFLEPSALPFFARWFFFLLTPVATFRHSNELHEKSQPTDWHNFMYHRERQRQDAGNTCHDTLANVRVCTSFISFSRNRSLSLHPSGAGTSPGTNLLVLSIRFRLFLCRRFRHVELISKGIELSSG